MQEIWVNDYLDCDPSGIHDSYLAFQRAVDKAAYMPNGGVVKVKSGQYIIAGGCVSNNRNIDKKRQRVSIVGEDQNSVKIIYTGTASACFSFTGAGDVEPEGHASHETFSDMTLISVNRTPNCSAFYGELLSFLRLERINVQNFDYGVYLQDVDQFSADNVMLRFNNKGGISLRNPSPTQFSTQPNNHTWKACTITNNSEYGFIWSGGSSINLIGGDVEYNGSGGTGFGLKFLNCGYEGSKGANIIGTYFEGNHGLADIFIEATEVNSYPILNCLHYVSADFKRTNSVYNSNHHIAMVVGPENSVGKQRLVTVGCGFKEYVGYTPTGFTPKIAYLLSPVTSDNYHDFGSLWGAAEEMPPFVQEINKVDALICNSSNQNIAPNTLTKWLLSSVIEPSPIWKPQIGGGDILIEKSGTYNFSVFTAFSSLIEGRKSLFITRNGNIVGYGESTGNSDVCSINSTIRVKAGDIISILIKHTCLNSLMLLGSNSAYSNLTVTRVYN